MFTSWDQHQPHRVVKRRSRAKDSCRTCKRRKVRCNEQRPQCHHCRRLGLTCEWSQNETQSSTSGRDSGEETAQLEDTSAQPSEVQVDSFAANDWNQGLAGLQPTYGANNATIDLDLDQMFDYASFMWRGTETFDQSSADVVPAFAPFANGDINTQFRDEHLTQISEAMSWPSPAAALTETELLDLFGRSNAPPMLMHIEARPKWASMRKMLLSMASSSAMARNAVLAFTSLQLRQTGQRDINHDEHYEKAKTTLHERMARMSNDFNVSGRELALLLAVSFLLTYMDLVSNRSSYAQDLLKQTHALVKSCDSECLGPLECRIISWLRLLDGRAVSAGGEGLFLNDSDQELSALDLSSPHQKDHDGDDPDDDVQGALLDALSSPGFAFFHKVQSFMGKISHIDPWHRSRGTVEDETQVMSIAAKISKDLVKLYRQRPPLMDLAVEGKLCQPYLQPGLAASVTRSLRTYLANYHASFIHLHRVAYKHLPRTQSVVSAMTVIQQIAKTMSATDENMDEPLPVNMLWPLLMWGCEEEAQETRQWILHQIRLMANSATNAGITADVLEEVQRRQDATGQRVDVRSVMQDVFHSNFAVV